MGSRSGISGQAHRAPSRLDGQIFTAGRPRRHAEPDGSPILTAGDGGRSWSTGSKVYGTLRRAKTRIATARFSSGSARRSSSSRPCCGSRPHTRCPARWRARPSHGAIETDDLHPRHRWTGACRAPGPVTAGPCPRSRSTFDGPAGPSEDPNPPSRTRERSSEGRCSARAWTVGHLSPRLRRTISSRRCEPDLIRPCFLIGR